MGIKIGVVGSGFASSFIPLFMQHPWVGEVVVADLIPERREALKQRFGLARSAPSLEALCETDVDAIAIFTNRYLHGPHALTALRAGKHVYSAVPMASSVDEIQAILEVLEDSPLVYMNGETSYYYPAALYCRAQFQAGNFGEFVYGEAGYYHDLSHGFYEAYQHSDGEHWRQAAGLPPMFYPTHSLGMLVSVTGAHALSVSCLGWTDHDEDGIFRVGANYWDNVFSNESALMRMSDGGMVRINEFRRIGWTGIGPRGEENLRLYGTKASYEGQANARVWTEKSGVEAMRDLEELLSCTMYAGPESEKDSHIDNHRRLPPDLRRPYQVYSSGYSPLHPVRRLPDEYAKLLNGHAGSHQFLADDFVKAVVTASLPPTHAWAAARYCIPGLVAHESALQEGKMLSIPDFGDPPPRWQYADVETKWNRLR